MKYVIRLCDPITQVNYYSDSNENHTRWLTINITPKLSRARIFDIPDLALDVVDRIREIHMPSVEEITDKELFEARLKGI